MACNITFVSPDGKRDSFQLATNSGGADLANWATSLPDEDYPDLAHLLNFGWSDAPAIVAGQIDHALASHPPSGDIAATATRLSMLLGGSDAGEVAMIGDLDDD